MANRNMRQQGNRRPDFARPKGYGRPPPPPVPAPVSPWQQPMAPMNPTNATLALANDLISNLLKSRQVAGPVPSLLDMPIRRDFPPERGFPLRNFDQGFNRMRSEPNFGRGPGNYVRPADRPNFRRNNNRGPNNQGRNQAQSKKQQDKKPEDKNQEVKKEEAKNEAADTDEPMPEDGAEGKTAEKQDGKQSADNKNAEEVGAKGGKGDAYEGIDTSLLSCHICNKVMWDGRSFENHLKGRAHHMMMNKTSESYALAADTMRQELQIQEMKLRRRSNQTNVQRKFYCTMCDIYATDGASHRMTTGHRKLKKYLHPSCTICNKEMATRIELDEHRLTPDHMRETQSKRKDKTKREAMVISTLAEEESYIRRDRIGWTGKYEWRGREMKETEKNKEADKKEGADKKEEDEKKEGDVKEGDEKKEGAEEKEGEQDQKEGTEENAEAAKPKKEAEPEDLILDIAEDEELSNVRQEQIPRYNAERAVGRSMLAPLATVECKLCRKLLDSPDTAEVHLRTWKHHVLFVKMLQSKRSQGAKKRASEDEAEGDEAKRRKVEKMEVDQANGTHEEEDLNEMAESDQNDAEKIPEDVEKEIDGILGELSADLDEEQNEPEPKEAESPKPASPPAAKSSPPKGTPRGRGRGRGRGRR